MKETLRKGRLYDESFYIQREINLLAIMILMTMQCTLGRFYHMNAHYKSFTSYHII